MRKKAGFNIEDRIRTYYAADGELASVLGDWAETIKAETLSVELSAADAPASAYGEDHKIDGVDLKLAVERI
jgi:hypothetical protein